MSDLRQAAQQALEAMEGEPQGWRTPAQERAITTLRAALEQYDKDRVWIEERKAAWAKDKEIARKNAELERERHYTPEPCDIAEDGVCEALECCKAPNPALTCLFTTQMEDSILNAFDLPPHKDIAIHAAHYTQPPRREWRSLSGEEIGAITMPDWNCFQNARAIEAALKERNA
jgi:hypothetical protein